MYSTITQQIHTPTHAFGDLSRALEGAGGGVLAHELTQANMWLSQAVSHPNNTVLENTHKHTNGRSLRCEDSKSAVVVVIFMTDALSVCSRICA